MTSVTAVTQGKILVTFINLMHPKNLEISGSTQSSSRYGEPSKPVIIVESELDAILIQQETSDLVCSIALGGVSKKPDVEFVELHQLLKKSSFDSSISGF